MVRVTVLFATFNGAHTLPRMLDTLERLASPTGGWKVIAVDNGSTDESRRILDDRAGALPMSVLSEPRRGKNVALNAGLADIEGDIIALTDDDVILPPDWLLAIEKVAAQQPGHDIFGGSIYPVWEEPPPEWVVRCVPTLMFSCTDSPEGPIHPDRIWGPSMAVRFSVFRQCRFAEEIGPNGSPVYAMGSETEFTRGAAKRGHLCWHFHTAPVGHIIRAHQLRPEWLLQRSYNLGRGDRRKGGVRHPIRQVFSISRAAARLAAAGCNVSSARLVGNFETQFRSTLKLRRCRGYLDEAFSSEKAG